ncbi:hypothetical protein C922_04605 [Plasmodium inui San Antonio 1]|uniref:Uncharacterized protein n=1 Tax=Plasmodium inui San Antonio 1 TaxID=1237626 RepID=W6ZW09_9APIC|nr:hypothetical protein C922_04605 [Plasmodium inui San Antonio 1]EUD64977.1 hypothetical protein C922_04605 [Plasmodium inui San Antonio 1]
MRPTKRKNTKKCTIIDLAPTSEGEAKNLKGAVANSKGSNTQQPNAESRKTKKGNVVTRKQQKGKAETKKQQKRKDETRRSQQSMTIIEQGVFEENHFGEVRIPSRVRQSYYVNVSLCNCDNTAFNYGRIVKNVDITEQGSRRYIVKIMGTVICYSNARFISNRAIAMKVKKVYSIEYHVTHLAMTLCNYLNVTPYARGVRVSVELPVSKKLLLNREQYPPVIAMVNMLLDDAINGINFNSYSDFS